MKIRRYILILLFLTSCGEPKIQMIDIEIDQAQDSLMDLANIPCGEIGNCPVGFYCLEEKLCCPPEFPQKCGDQCFPQDCQCIIDEDFTLCVAGDSQYCGKGVSCKKLPEEECHLDPIDENYYCVASGNAYCGNGVVCDLSSEDCIDKDGKFFCIAKDKMLCESGIECFKDIEVCGIDHCCPKKQPIECGNTCCFLNNGKQEQCADPAKSVCVPQWATYCEGEICVAGEACASDGNPVCYSENGEYCGNGKSCPPGTVCAADGGCCPQGQPQRCGKTCCPGYYPCVDTVSGKKCIPPGTEPCGETWCDPGEYCADENTSLCLHDFDTLCPDGHICKDGTYCADSTCCSFFNPNQNCGTLCCPLSGWKCIGSGEACIPDGATYLGDGKYCDPGTKLNPENNHCDPVGWEPCGSGSACVPGTKCAEDEIKHTMQCCPASQTALCGDICCYTGFDCVHDGEKNICLPPGAEYCWGMNVNEWCSAGTTCGKKGKKCIPKGAIECENGDFCSGNQKCTGAEPACCSLVAQVPCIDKCCLNGYLCATFNGVPTCIPPDAEVCYNGIYEDSVCYNDTFCESDGYCIDDKYKNTSYNYCGGGKLCLNDLNCTGLCSDVCCVDSTCNVFDLKDCTDNGNIVTCCKPGTSVAADIKKLEDEWADKCANIKCSVVQNKTCCTYDKTTSVGCLKGCVSDGQLCYDIPSSNSSPPSAQIQESGLLPQKTPYEIGDECYDDVALVGFPGWLAFVSVSVSFHPVGFAINYDPKTGFYDVNNDHNADELDLDNWIQGNPGDEILVIEAVWMIDNLEGNNCPHGPYAQFYILIHRKKDVPFDLYKVLWATLKDKTVPGYGYNTHFLKGPLQGKDSWEICVCYFEVLGICADEDCWSSYGDFDSDVKQEWIDYLYLKYTPAQAGIYKWETGEDIIYLSLRESDGEPKFGRYDDYMGLQPVKRVDTKKPCGVWVPLYKYDNVKEDDDPNNDNDVDPVSGKPYYYKKGSIAAWVLLRTVVK